MSDDSDLARRPRPNPSHTAPLRTAPLRTELPAVGEHLDVAIDGVARDGRGTAEIAGRKLHVEGMLPGDRGWVRLTAVDRHGHGAHGVLVALSERGHGRRDVACAAHEDNQSQGCTGCPWLPWTPASQRLHLRTLLAGHGLHVDAVGWVGDGEDRTDDGACGYRWSAKRVVFQDASGRLRLGSYRARSHHGAAMTGCLVDHPTVRAAADELERVAQSLRVPAWHGGRPGARQLTERGGLRYVWLKTDGAQVLLTLITSGMAEVAVRALAEALELPAGVAWSVQDGQGNSMRGDAPTQLRGLSALTVALCGVAVQAGPLGFLQPNPAVASRCYEALVQDEDDATSGGVSSGALALALDLYAGAGVTTALLRQRFATVLPSESWPESAALLGITAETTEVFLARWVAQRRATPDLIIANPPRAGLRSAVTALLTTIGAPRLHIMSCSPQSLQADLQALAPRYELISLQAWATLPQTPHVELVAKLRLR